MFGAKYSRMKFWIISICLFIPTVIINVLAKQMEKVGNFDAAIVLYGVAFLLAIIWINTLANRIRDYGANPWLSLLSWIPLVNIIMAFYYGIGRYKNNNSLETENNTSDTSLTKAVYNHSKDVANDIKPAIDDYKERHTVAKSNQSDSAVSIQNGINAESTEDDIYESIMLEIEEDKKVKSTWAKALAQSDGNYKKAESLYINLRVKNIMDEQISRQQQDILNRLGGKKLSSQEKDFLNKYNVDLFSPNVEASSSALIVHTVVGPKKFIR